MRLQKLLFKTLLFYSISICSTIVHAYEQIKSFDSDITINKNGSMSVRETIVYNTDRSDRHGITREFPTVYKNKQGALYYIDFDIKNITINGKAVPFHSKPALNGRVLFIGDPNYYIPPGTYTYAISYDTNRQLGFFKEHDELYWNVTGTGWRLPINYASARITLPQKVPTDKIKTAGYHGYFGERNKDYQSKILPDGSIFFETTKGLFPGQGLTIVAGWPKGIIPEPSWLQKLWWLLQDNLAVLWMLIGSLLLSVYYFFTNRHLKKDVQPGTVIPRFYPPEHVSPGLSRYITKMGYDSKQLAATIVDMAVKGLLTINYKSSVFGSHYTLQKKKDITGEYQELQDILFAYDDTLFLGTQNQTIIQRAAQFLREIYQSTSKNYFKSTGSSIAFGYAITALFFVTSLFFSSSIFNVWYVLLFIIMLFINILYTGLLAKVYTPKGLQVKEEIDGFKMFLKTTEEERLKIIGTPPTKTPQLYEEYLPYAIALGVEKQWTQQFASVFEKLERAGTPYQPIWYVSRQPFNVVNMSGFASNVSAISQTPSITSSQYAPGSTSGFGRGGYSGGGGGGGGGGSW